MITMDPNSKGSDNMPTVSDVSTTERKKTSKNKNAFFIRSKKNSTQNTSEESTAFLKYRDVDEQSRPADVSPNLASQSPKANQTQPTIQGPLQIHRSPITVHTAPERPQTPQSSQACKSPLTSNTPQSSQTSQRNQPSQQGENSQPPRIRLYTDDEKLLQQERDCGVGPGRPPSRAECSSKSPSATPDTFTDSAIPHVYKQANMQPEQCRSVVLYQARPIVEFENWTKLGLALMYLKDGLQQFVVSEMERFQDDIVFETGRRQKSSQVTRCSHCTTANILPCPTTGICSGNPCWYHERNDPRKARRDCPNRVCRVYFEHILQFHIHIPNWITTDARRWSRDAFEISKCYFANKWYLHCHSYADVNVVDLLSVILYNKWFSRCLSNNPHCENSRMCQAKNIGNSFMQSVPYDVTEAELNNAITIFFAILTDEKNLLIDESAMTAAAHLHELMSSKYVVDQEEKNRVFKEHATYMRSKDQWRKTALDYVTLKLSVDLLSHQDMIPTPSDLNNACKMLGKQSPTLNAYCDKICAKIKETSPYIIHVWAGYKPENVDDCITFVAITTERKTSREDTLILGFNVFLCNENDCNNEAESVMKSRQRQYKPYTNAEVDQLQTCLQQHSAELMALHSNITVISACSVKSRQFKLEHTNSETANTIGNGVSERDVKSEIVFKTCIVLYVHVKGIVPLEEEPFPKTIDGFPTDVREGMFEFYGGPQDHHDPLLMGCAIGRSPEHDGCQYGTLGAFVDVNLHGTLEEFCMTSAHVLLNEDEWAETKLTGEKTFCFPAVGVDQPPRNPSHPNDRFGDIRKVIYDKGDKDRPGMEIALVKIHKRNPVSGDFPEGDFSFAGFDAGQKMVFNSGEVIPTSEFVEKRPTLITELIKFGASTGVRRGSFNLVGTAVREAMHQFKGERMELHKQVEVLNIGLDFADEGDSGSLVFGVYNNDREQLRPMGIVVGGVKGVGSVVTPIADILRRLGVEKLKTFHVSAPEPMSGTQDESQFQTTASGPNSTRRAITAGPNADEIDDTVHSKLATLEERVGTLDKKVDDGFDKMRNDMQSGMNDGFQKVRSDVQSDIVTVRNEMRSNMREDIRSSNDDLLRRLSEQLLNRPNPN